jgi:hypothetical protein
MLFDELPPKLFENPKLQLANTPATATIAAVICWVAAC